MAVAAAPAADHCHQAASPHNTSVSAKKVRRSKRGASCNCRMVSCSLGTEVLSTSSVLTLVCFATALLLSLGAPGGGGGNLSLSSATLAHTAEVCLTARVSSGSGV